MTPQLRTSCLLALSLWAVACCILVAPTNGENAEESYMDDNQPGDSPAYDNPDDSGRPNGGAEYAAGGLERDYGAPPGAAILEGASHHQGVHSEDGYEYPASVDRNSDRGAERGPDSGPEGNTNL
ncbi:hypothetical protein HPB47_023067 [Ixodes persulcatus]|uniref:Uncharacterized protein n=1 Tax=Ixodes persulcatus TaxID=34615 RepID=A0AC60QA00_IXOPE|nr:hypothetical protein HPB47_023067 [Ixodes persulcatus]